MERLTLIPTEHWESNKLKGVSVYVKKEPGNFVGNFVFKPVNIKTAFHLVTEHLNNAGYETTTLLYGEEIKGTKSGNKI